VNQREFPWNPFHPHFPGEAFSPEPAETLFGGVTLNIDDVTNLWVRWTLKIPVDQFRPQDIFLALPWMQRLKTKDAIKPIEG